MRLTRYILSDDYYSFYSYGGLDDFPAICRGTHWPEYWNGRRWRQCQSFLKFCENTIQLTREEFVALAKTQGLVFTEDLAYELARKGHDGQTRKDGVTPYLEHPMDVVDVLKFWGVADNDTIAAAYAHDLLEDTAVTRSEIKRALGPAVLRKVEKLTHEPNVPKDDYLRALANDADLWCVLIKAADRICNTRDFILAGTFSYARKYFAKAAPVFDRLQHEWEPLGDDVYANLARDRADVTRLLLLCGNSTLPESTRRRLNARLANTSGNIWRTWRNILQARRTFPPGCLHIAFSRRCGSNGN